MCKILSISNQKGGTSKSTLAVNLGAALRLAGQKVLIVDFDPQGDASAYLGFEEENPIKVHPNIIYSTFCGSRMFLFSVSPLSRNL